MQEDNLKLEDLLLHPQVEYDTHTINNIAIIGAYTATWVDSMYSFLQVELVRTLLK